MSSRNERLAEALRQRQLYLLRHQVSVRGELDRFLVTLDNAIAAAIVSVSPSEPAREIYRRQRVDKLIAGVADSIKLTYRDMQTYHRQEMKQLADVEAAFMVKAANDLFEKAPVSLSLSSSDALQLVDSALIAGEPVKEWWADQSRSVQRSFAQQMRVGFIGGESEAELIRRVRGSKDLNYTDGIMEVSRRMSRHRCGYRLR